MKRVQFVQQTNLMYSSVSIPVGTGTPIIEPELSNAELAAIGLVCAQWAEAEHVLNACTQAMATHLGESCPVDFRSDGFSKRLRGLRELSELLPRDDRDHWLKICDRAANLSSRRDKVIHGRWIWKSSDDELSAVQTDFLEADKGFLFTLPNIEQLATDIGALLFDVIFPKGVTQAMSNFVAGRIRNPKSSPVHAVECSVPPAFWPRNGEAPNE